MKKSGQNWYKGESFLSTGVKREVKRYPDGLSVNPVYSPE